MRHGDTRIRVSIVSVLMLWVLVDARISHAITIVYPDDDGYAFSVEDRELIQRIASATEREVRALLPNLPNDLTLRVREGSDVVPQTGSSAGVGREGLTTINYRANSLHEGGVEAVVMSSLRHALFHEMHHLVRRNTPHERSQIPMINWIVDEGLASVFERDFGGSRFPWRSYEDVPIEEWTAEVLALAATVVDYNTWMFEHHDGRTDIGYRVGTYLVDLAVDASGQSAIELTGESSDTIVELAGY